jgi:molybdate transport system substrate-binding protein
MAPLAVGLVLLAAGSAACTSSDGRRAVLVSAAASLTDVFGRLEAEFETAHPEFDVVLNFGGSSALREQILAGAPADVFASANPENMEQVQRSVGTVADPAVFATNTMQIAIPRDNPGEVGGLEDLEDSKLLIGLCAAGVPCGDFGRRVLANAGVTVTVDTNEPNVRALLTKVELGELDAAIVYATDVAAARVTGIPIPDTVNVTAQYPIAALSTAPNPGGAAVFVDFVLSGAGRVILSQSGFGTP